MSVTDMSAVLKILRSLYGHVQTLEEFVSSLDFREGRRVVLVEEADSNLLKFFVTCIFVCFDKKLQQVPSCNQVQVNSAV